MGAKKIVTVPSNGQISIGKEWAGREIQIEQIEDGQILITAGSFMPDTTFTSKKAQGQLQAFNQWEKKSAPKKTDLKALRQKLAKK
jgi:hypothetical protein